MKPKRQNGSSARQSRTNLWQPIVSTPFSSRRAANLGLADSQFNLAVLYERGMGVQQSLINAYKWYAVAAQQGDAESKARIDALSTQLSPEDKTAAQKAAASFRPDGMDRNANVPPDQATVIGG